MRYRDGHIAPMRHPERAIEAALAAEYAALPDTVTVTRQLRFPDGRIADLVVERVIWPDDGDWYTSFTVVEVKATRAGRAALRQVHGYARRMRDLCSQWGSRWDVDVALAAPTFSPEIEAIAEHSARSDGLLRLIRVGPQA